MIAFNAAIILCQITKVKNNVFPSLGNQILCRHRGVRLQRLFSTQKVLVNDILVGLERILDYADIGLERFDCTSVRLYMKMILPSMTSHYWRKVDGWVCPVLSCDLLL